ncbi:MAG: type I-F CRISPR-associated protein Csy2 [Candidatus Competibacteraceae bacterium]|nr:type I-F CRISPR-associated protein Csy2 [Candidatus Competibacteraceae bacterium]MCP5124900.1 type I-F CRISPR-associated protein Csy2 [Gammaproteobacteria bacterium]HRX70992.1 type I-F CRISPR-associated protein Csy2 [Candidatus Competibacteraceae bacterium]
MISPLIDGGGLLILPRLQIQNANAISGPLTWGFPAPTAFIGFAHALERRLSEGSPYDFGEVREGFDGVGIVCHGFQPQITQPAGRRTQVFNLTRNPVGKDGMPTALIEEGRIHLEITLIIVVKDGFGEYDGDEFARMAHHITLGMRLAGGSLLPARSGERYAAQWQVLPDDLDGQKDLFSKLRRRLLPGYALVQRQDLLVERLAEIRVTRPDATALDTLLDLSRLNIEPVGPDPTKPQETLWQVRKRPGWLVPLPIGYAGISPLYRPGEVENARDDHTPFRFVESLYSLGQWIGPHHLEHLRQLLWNTEDDAENGIYRCVNHYSEATSNARADLV